MYIEMIMDHTVENYLPLESTLSLVSSVHLYYHLSNNVQ